MTYNVRILEPSDWQALKASRLNMVQKTPEDYYRTPAEEAALSDAEWIERCTETRGDHCAFGIFHNGRLTGSVEVMRYNPPVDGQFVLGRLDVPAEHHRDSVIRNLVDAAIIWAAGHDDFNMVVSAARNDRPLAIRDLEICGFTIAHDDNDTAITENFTWPSTGEQITQTWQGVALTDLRPGMPARLTTNPAPFCNGVHLDNV